ncbi:uncharacterized protein CLUP02_06974 [Colletotrichum lupini]|uniref:Uncharacterized protein n=1 Tax=Colletotrichum lupini TaxID=145971 RepID=A0A9Q8WF79_9PEZI|nr:uncharacterized protein CLUP02_06974 [Colletotrichum lupini]UQC81488.1 hypothetical protein CLUP02_06974 [Colletotrichum lupini]
MILPPSIAHKLLGPHQLIGFCTSSIQTTHCEPRKGRQATTKHLIISWPYCGTKPAADPQRKPSPPPSDSARPAGRATAAVNSGQTLLDAKDSTLPCQNSDSSEALYGYSVLCNKVASKLKRTLCTDFGNRNVSRACSGLGVDNSNRLLCSVLVSEKTVSGAECGLALSDETTGFPQAGCCNATPTCTGLTDAFQKAKADHKVWSISIRPRRTAQRPSEINGDPILPIPGPSSSTVGSTAFLNILPNMQLPFPTNNGWATMTSCSLQNAECRLRRLKMQSCTLGQFPLHLHYLSPAGLAPFPLQKQESATLGGSLISLLCSVSSWNFAMAQTAGASELWNATDDALRPADDDAQTGLKALRALPSISTNPMGLISRPPHIFIPSSLLVGPRPSFHQATPRGWFPVSLGHSLYYAVVLMAALSDAL